MAVTDFQTPPVDLSTSGATIVAGVTSGQRVVTKMTFTNRHTAGVTVTMCEDTGTSMTASKRILSAVYIPPNTSFVFKGPHMIETNATARNLNCLASVASVVSVKATGYDST